MQRLIFRKQQRNVYCANCQKETTQPQFLHAYYDFTLTAMGRQYKLFYNNNNYTFIIIPLLVLVGKFNSLHFNPSLAILYDVATPPATGLTCNPVFLFPQCHLKNGDISETEETQNCCLYELLKLLSIGIRMLD